MYYRLVYDPSEACGYIEQEENTHETLSHGGKVDEASLIIPYRYSLEVDPDEGLSLIDFYESRKLMSKRLVNALQSVGVDNLQVFPAEIIDDASGEKHQDFVVVNIVGLVSCADEDSSQSTPLADVAYFHKLIIDPSRAQGLKMFRLAESRMDIIVSEDVAQVISKGDFKGVKLEPVEKSTAASE